MKLSRLATAALFTTAILVLPLLGCTSGGGSLEGQVDSAMSAINENWRVYEIEKQAEGVLIKVDVPENVSFEDGQKAVNAVLSIDPKLTGYIEFYNSEFGMVLRKMEIRPAT